MTVSQAIAESVRTHRRERGWNQERLSQEMNDRGFSTWRRETVTEVERGDKGQGRRVSVSELLGLAEAFGVGVAELLWSGSPLTLAPDGAAIESRARLIGLLVRAEDLAELMGPEVTAAVDATVQRELRFSSAAQDVAKDLRGIAERLETEAVEYQQRKVEQ